VSALRLFTNCRVSSQGVPSASEGTNRSNLKRLPPGVYPELCKILRGVYAEERSAQNDAERRARNDDSSC